MHPIVQLNFSQIFCKGKPPIMKKSVTIALLLLLTVVTALCICGVIWTVKASKAKKAEEAKKARERAALIERFFGKKNGVPVGVKLPAKGQSRLNTVIEHIENVMYAMARSAIAEVGMDLASIDLEDKKLSGSERLTLLKKFHQKIQLFPAVIDRIRGLYMNYDGADMEIYKSQNVVEGCKTVFREQSKCATIQEQYDSAVSLLRDFNDLMEMHKDSPADILHQYEKFYSFFWKQDRGLVILTLTLITSPSRDIVKAYSSYLSG